MRRADRAVTDRAQIEDFLRRQTVLRVAFWDEGEIYIVPVNYGYCREGERDVFYFHGACAGRKYALSLHTPRVGFELDGSYQLQQGREACSWSATYQSVVGTGRVSLVTEPEAKRKGLAQIMRQATGREDWAFPEESVNRTAVFRLEAEQLSCKANREK